MLNPPFSSHIFQDICAPIFAFYYFLQHSKVTKNFEIFSIGEVYKKFARPKIEIPFSSVFSLFSYGCFCKIWSDCIKKPWEKIAPHKPLFFQQNLATLQTGNIANFQNILNLLSNRCLWRRYNCFSTVLIFKRNTFWWGVPFLIEKCCKWFLKIVKGKFEYGKFCNLREFDWDDFGG